MAKLTDFFTGNKRRKYLQLVSDNREAIDKYNGKMISILPLIGWVTMLLPLLATPFSNSKAGAVPVYLIAFAIYLTLFIVFKLPKIKKYSLFGLYICFSVLFLLAIYLSVIHTPNMRATVLLGVFCITPLSFTDRPLRMNLFIAFWFVLHGVLALYLKPQYALDDTINCLCFSFLGCFLGNKVVEVRLESYESHRLLILEKETDVLTGLPNRRKLFETLAYLETTDAEKPTGVLMLDIDRFKEINDNYGHVVGDKCLSSFGEVLIKYMQNFRLQFYRYGGEEFVALAYGYSKKEILYVAESLRIAIQGTDMDGLHITVSIGAAYCGDEQVQSYEKVVMRADEAAYRAKSSGRNSVCMEQDESMQNEPINWL